MWNENNVDMNAKNCFTKEYVIKGLFGIQVIVNLNMINQIMLENIQIIKTVSVHKAQLINQLKNVVKILTRINYIQL